MYTEEKVINGKIVRRSASWPNYGCTYCGTVYRWDREKKMKSTTTQFGYLSFRLSENNVTSTRFVHVIVAQCWIENDDPLNKVNVNHKDGNKGNPHGDNLEWVTRSQNQRHAVNTGLKQKGQELYNSKLTNEQVHEVCKLLVSGWRIKDIADKFGVSRDLLSKIKSGDSYSDIRASYKVPCKYQNELSVSTVKWVCEKIVQGYADANISAMSINKKLSVQEIKRVRNKIRYKEISDSYF